MSSYYARTGYDKKYLKEAFKQSANPGKYKLSNNQWFNKNGCNAVNGPRGNRVGDTGEFNCNLPDRTQIESALTNRGTPGCRKCNTTISDKNKITNKYSCDPVSLCKSKIDQEYSRLRNPVDNYRGLSTFSLQMDFPIINPINWTFDGNNKCGNKKSINRDGCNTRLMAKDSYSNRVFGQ